MVLRLAVCVVLLMAYCGVWSVAMSATAADRTEAAVVDQFSGSPPAAGDAVGHLIRNEGYLVGWLTVVLLCVGVMWSDIKGVVALLAGSHRVASAMILLLCLSLTGCYRPFEPIDLQVIGTNEEGFLIPLLGDAAKQQSTNSEEFLQKSLVSTKQVKIPQQWVQLGYEYVGPNGKWQPAATLIKVDRSPVTRMWTADPATGTSNKNEAVWVMTSDQVEFSTGWVATARISSREDAVKFLYNYPNGSIESVMDREVRALVQTTFGLEVTDQPMSKLRNEATPHLLAVVTKVTAFFAERGLTITNLGISGGFIYKDVKIQDKMVEMFNAEQELSIAIAKAAALQKTAEGKASAAKLQATGEADAIKAVADAKAYEIEKANADLPTYLSLKRIEIEKEKIEKWDGKFPSYYLGTSGPDSLLMLPSPAK